MINKQLLRSYCLSDIPAIMRRLNGEIINGYAFKDNGSNILAVAHLDTALQSDVFEVFDLDDDYAVLCPNLDDRLGVYIIMDLLPKMGINVDVLLTTGEETAQSTARNFVTEKKYNWIVEFDRRGVDTVCYDYSDKSWDSTIQEYFKLGQGTFTDISELENLGCKALNIGIGYYNEHTHNSYAILSQTISQVEAFKGFYTANKNTFFKHVPMEYEYYDPYMFGACECLECGMVQGDNMAAVCAKCGGCLIGQWEPDTQELIF